MTFNQPVAAAVATLVLKESQILLGKRIRHNQFVGWQCPGGYIHPGESVQQAAKRQCLEKAGIEISEISSGPYTSNIFPDTSPLQHTVTLYQVAHKYSVCDLARFQDAEASWQWFAFGEIPEQCFLPLKNLLEICDLARL